MFVQVYVAIHKKSVKRVAVKITPKEKISDRDEVCIRREAEILKILNHNHIVKLFDFMEDDASFFTVIEILEGGELFDRIVKKVFYTEKEARDVLLAILSAIEYCHDRDIVHRDIKPENLLLSSAEDDADVKLADFGFAKWLPSGNNSLITACGTPSYIAPEIISGHSYGEWGEETDIFE